MTEDRLSSLPQDALVVVFNSLAVADLQYLFTTSKFFLNLAKSSSLWRSLLYMRWMSVIVHDGAESDENCFRTAFIQSEARPPRPKLGFDPAVYSSHLRFVLDIGTETFKAGITQPGYKDIIQFPSLKFLLQPYQRQPNDAYYRKYVGVRAADTLHALLDLRQPIERGEYTMSSEDTASLVDAAFAILHEVPHNSHVLVIEHPHRDISQRMSTLEYLFERETAAAVGFAYSGVAGLFGYDVRTGICVDVGAGVTQVVPIYEGLVQTHAIVTGDIGGVDVTHDLWYSCKSKLPDLNHRANFRIVDRLKRQYGVTMSEYLERNHINAQLPDLSTIPLGDERFQCFNVLFDSSTPSTRPQSELSVPQLISLSLSRCSVQMRPAMAQCIHVIGGTTTAVGFPERLALELSALLPYPCKVNAAENRFHGGYYGAKKLAVSPSFDRHWVTSLAYAEHGSSLALI